MIEGPDPRIGMVLHSRYQILQRLAEGAMAVVYRGERVRLHRPVAIKFLHESYASSEDGMRRFEREAMAMSQLAHPNCVSVTDFGLDEGAPYLVMDFIDGQSLREALRIAQRMRPARALDITRQILAGLAHAHAHGIIHRDIKPENILVASVEGHGERVSILDFGLAKLRNENSVTTGLAVGTPSYMSPEQTMGERVDERVDVYATGIILYELLVGKKPFMADSPFDIMRMQREQAPPPLAIAAPDLKASPELEALIGKALAKRREARFPSAAAFGAALDAVPEAQRRGASRPPVAARKRGGLLIAVGLLVIAAVVAAVILGQG
jgi:eukaryotic-like serine/threonine-protein kinase